MNSDELKAKKFFIDKVLMQAQKEHVNLSEAERYMLSWTEDPGKDFSPDQGLTDQFEKETTDSAFEKKVSGLLRNAYVSDVQNDKQQAKKYRNALRVLNEGDHYITIMAERATKEGAVSANWLKDKASLLITAIGVLICGLLIINILALVSDCFLLRTL